MTAKPLWTGLEVARLTGGKVSEDWAAHGVAIDSRDVVPGDLFVALKGLQFDGHTFVGDALKAGAVAAIVDHHDEKLATAGQLAIVDETDVALKALAKAARRRVDGPVIGVTGSVGKTGVKDAIGRALGRSRQVHTSIRSFNNHVGVPVSLARMPKSSDSAVFEFGMSRAGEIAPMSRLARPNVAVITTVGPAHMAGFLRESDVADAKAEIFLGMNRDGIAVLNRDNRHYDRLAAAAKEAGIGCVMSFALEDERADIRPRRIAAKADCTCMTVDVMGDMLTFKVGIPGSAWALNALAVLGAVKAVQGDVGLAGLSLAGLAPLPGRGLRSVLDLKGARFTLIDESYNANPISMISALETLGYMEAGPRGRRIAVLGDMADLGKKSAAYHAAIAPYIERHADVLVAVGDQMGEIAEQFGARMRSHRMKNADQALEHLVHTLRPGDVVLVKASNEQGLRSIVNALKAQGRPVLVAAA